MSPTGRHGVDRKSRPAGDDRATPRWHARCDAVQAVRFNLTIVDPPGYPFTHFLFDLVRLLRGGIETLGHPCSVTQNAIEPGRVNILVGIHNIQKPEAARGLFATSAPIVLLQTEIVKDKGFNRSPTDERLAEVFLPIARRAVAVWDSSVENIAALRAHGIQAEMLQFGYDRAVEDICHKPEKDVDFFFYGSLTPHRKDVIQKLAQLGYEVRVLFDQPAIYRNDLIARSEIVLSMRQSEDMAHLPHARILYLVNNRCLVVGETGLEQRALEDLFLSADPADFIELCRETRARRDRRELAELHYERLRARPMSGSLEPLIESIARSGGIPQGPR